MAKTRQDKQLRREFSAGAVVLRHMRHQWWVAVIEPAKRGNPEDRQGIIALPKGNVEPAEHPEQTARREVLEETGLHTDLVTKLGKTHYVYTRNWSRREKISKTVTFYLMKYRSGRIGRITAEMQHEVKRTYWMPLQEAVARLSYKGHREMTQRALRYVQYPKSPVPATSQQVSSSSMQQNTILLYISAACRRAIFLA